MLQIKDVEDMLNKALSCEHVEVEGDGHHFFVKIVSREFEGLSRLERHRFVKKLLSNEIASNELHALSIQLAATPTEWKNNFN